MKRALVFSFAVALVLALPALSQDGEAPDAKLRKDVKELKELVAAQGKEIAALKSYVDVMKAESATLLSQLQKSEKEGFFYPAPHVPAKKALLHGLQRYATVGTTGKAPE